MIRSTLGDPSQRNELGAHFFLFGHTVTQDLNLAKTSKGKTVAVKCKLIYNNRFCAAAARCGGKRLECFSEREECKLIAFIVATVGVLILKMLTKTV